MTRRTVLCTLAVAAGLSIAVDRLSGVGATAALADDGVGAAAPTVVELFTSQGCSSCPPADKVLYDLAGRDDIVAISWHVNYWDYIGWTDPFATDWSTNRQRAYRGQLGRNYVYTPQMVIDGRHDVVGSRRRDVTHMIDTSREVAAERIGFGLVHDTATGELVITFPGQRLDGPLDIWLVGYSGVHETRVSRGENRGATLRNTHVARTLDRLGSWDGIGRTLRVPMPAHDDVAGCAVILQEPGQGAIRGAAKLDLES